MPRIPTQSGRSLTEMLGVLAIIGVLSIGGVLGYHYATTKYKANELINEFNIRSIGLIEQAERGVRNPKDNRDINWGGYSFGLNYGVRGEKLAMLVGNVPQPICKDLLNRYLESPQIFVYVQNDGSLSEQCAEGENYLYIEYNLRQ